MPFFFCSRCKSRCLRFCKRKNRLTIDLAYVYIKKSDIYENLAFLSGCDEAKQNGIKPFRKELTEIREKTNNQILSKIDLITEKCSDRDFPNECLENKIKKQIKKAFEPKEQKEILKELEKAKNANFKFYDMIYNSNKYCIGQCGIYAQSLAYEDEARQLKSMLKKLIYLNETKNGY